MVINFADIDIRKRPQLILQTADDRIIQSLGCALNIKASFRYNEVSELSFDYPAYSSGTPTPGYDEIKGMRIVDLRGYGKFTVNKISTSKEGVREIKSVLCYSLEHELCNLNV